MIIVHIKEILVKDLRESLKNRTILIVIILPVIASVFFTLISGPQIEKKFQVGIIEKDNHNLKSYLTQNVKNFESFSYNNLDDGVADVKSGDIDCLIIYRNPKDYKVYINSQDPVTYLFLKGSIKDILRNYLDIKPDIKMEIISINNTKLSTSFLPIWITITMTMIGILIISGNLAEEKDNRTLAALLITPIDESNIIIAKGLSGLLLSLITVIIMCILNGFLPANLLNFIFFVCLLTTASVCFTSIGLIIGVFANSQSAARSLGTVIYFPLLFPALIYNLSQFTRKLAGFFPTYYLYRGLDKLMYNNYPGKELLILTFFAIILSGAAYVFFKRMVRYNEL